MTLPATLHPLSTLWHTSVRCQWQQDADTRTDLHPWHQWTDVPMTVFDTPAARSHLRAGASSSKPRA